MKAGRVFYSYQDMHPLKGILLFISRGLPLEDAKWRVDHPTQAVADLKAEVRN